MWKVKISQYPMLIIFFYQPSHYLRYARSKSAIICNQYRCCCQTGTRLYCFHGSENVSAKRNVCAISRNLSPPFLVLCSKVLKAIRYVSVFPKSICPCSLDYSRQYSLNESECILISLSGDSKSMLYVVTHTRNNSWKVSNSIL